MIRLILKIVGIILFILFVCAAAANDEEDPEVSIAAQKMLGVSILCLWWGFKMFSRTGFILTAIVNLFAFALLGSSEEYSGDMASFDRHIDEMYENELAKREFEEELERLDEQREYDREHKNDFYYF